MVGPITCDDEFITISDLAGSENRSKDRYSEDMDLYVTLSTMTAVSFSPLPDNMVTSKSPTSSPVCKYTKGECEESKVETDRIVPFKKHSSVQQVQERTKGMKGIVICLFICL